MRLLILFVISLLVACAGTPPEHASYLLRSDKGVESRQLVFDGDAYLGGLTLADYIDQPGLVLDKGEGKIHAAKYHQWAEPLRVSLRQFLSAEISAQLGHDVPPYQPVNKPAQRIDINIDQLHGDDKGQAVLVAFWSISSAEGTSTHQFAETTALASDGYDALVTAETSLLQQLSQAIAASL